MRLANLVEAKDPRRLDVQRPAAASAAISRSGTSESGNPGVPNTKLPKKVR
ncbi:hypothetical protein QA633_05100 [Bradyrhizobium barranii]|uniref:hypothetical protein n=1 Tax=Bradyrhizobium barranii TaxID=2992140 RepID=UPI0024B188F1|nr:hypothetical protein [Bradyrhizobium barranii]WFT96502.1 hypothetical protein QA633_05100 [Bradyrhizobium barranii]